ncbi:MAG: T9SS type A sorting domain-containing protein [Bacteroidales bacterium]|nr:T9SS type A sorting domain-containing protein [Bacteroidales bacterium]
MKKVMVITALLTACFGLKAQAIFSTVGGEAASGSAKLSYTAGQVATQPAKARVTNAERLTAKLTEGVQQAYSIEELKIDGVTPIAADIKIYPNPTTDNITVRVVGESQQNYTLYDVNGRKLSNGKLQNGETSIDMSDLPAGSYVLKVTGNGAENGYRINKAK